MTGLDALAQLHDRDRERGIDPFVPSSVIQLAPAEPPGEPLFIERVDWHEEELERRRRDAVPLDVEALEDTTTEPAKKHATPNLREVRRWRAQQMRAAS